MTDGDLLWKIIGISSVLVNLILALKALRRDPPVSEELYRDFATKTEVKQLREEFLKTTGEVFEVLRHVGDKFAHEVSTLTAQVNRISGILERCPGPDACGKDRHNGRR